MDIDLDTPANKREIIFNDIKEEFGHDKCLNVCTFKTEGSKSALLTAARGLGINKDEAQSLANLIKLERGVAPTIQECIERVGGFKDKLNEFDQWEYIALSIEGLIVGRSIHASGFNIYQEPYTASNAMMRAPNGVPTTCWNLENSDYAGNLKLDFLTINALDKIKTAMDLLIEDNVIEWQGNLKKTYDKYFYPEILERENEDMWKLLHNALVTDLFQFEKEAGINVIKDIKPTNIKELALANSLMRIMGDNKETPLKKYMRYKNNIQEAYNDMKSYGLDDKDIRIVERNLKSNNFVAVEQEDLMEMSIDKEVSGFTIAESNVLRKAIAKKKPEVMAKVKKMFYDRGEQCGAKKPLLDYIWIECIMPQALYSFSRNHVLPYTLIALQQMNIVHKYGSVYWDTACLSINAAADEENTKNKSTNYGKIATAIGHIQSRGTKVALPHINKSYMSFRPDVEHNEILFGLKGINGIGDEVVNNLISNRPYKSLEDFKERSGVKHTQTLQLIKSGAFDTLYPNKTRKEIAKEYITIHYRIEKPAKDKLTYSNIKQLKEFGVLPKSYQFNLSLKRYALYVTKKHFQYDKINQKIRYLISENLAIGYFYDTVIHLLDEGVDYEVTTNDQIIVVGSKLKNKIKEVNKQFEEWCESDEALKLYNDNRHLPHLEKDWNKYCLGSISKWEMESLSYYHGTHELAHIHSQYGVKEFRSLPSTPKVSSSSTNAKGITYEQYELTRICGTVLDKDKTKTMITILAHNGVVVKVKMYGQTFHKYDKQLSSRNEKGANEVQEQSWWTRGNKVLLTGFRRDDYFIPRTYKEHVYSYPILLIKSIDNNGKLVLQYGRNYNDK